MRPLATVEGDPRPILVMFAALLLLLPASAARGEEPASTATTEQDVDVAAHAALMQLPVTDPAEIDRAVLRWPGWPTASPTARRAIVTIELVLLGVAEHRQGTPQLLLGEEPQQLASGSDVVRAATLPIGVCPHPCTHPDPDPWAWLPPGTCSPDCELPPGSALHLPETTILLLAGEGEPADRVLAVQALVAELSRLGRTEAPGSVRAMAREISLPWRVAVSLFPTPLVEAAADLVTERERTQAKRVANLARGSAGPAGEALASWMELAIEPAAGRAFATLPLAFARGFLEDARGADPEGRELIRELVRRAARQMGTKQLEDSAQRALDGASDAPCCEALRSVAPGLFEAPFGTGEVLILPQQLGPTPARESARDQGAAQALIWMFAAPAQLDHVWQTQGAEVGRKLLQEQYLPMLDRIVSEGLGRISDLLEVQASIEDAVPPAQLGEGGIPGGSGATGGSPLPEDAPPSTPTLEDGCDYACASIGPTCGAFGSGDLLAEVTACVHACVAAEPSGEQRERCVQWIADAPSDGVRHRRCRKLGWPEPTLLRCR